MVKPFVQLVGLKQELRFIVELVAKIQQLVLVELAKTPMPI
jgi:hypothetical protein